MPESSPKLIGPITGEIAFAGDITDEISACLTYNWEDYGIGPYEFWGMRGVQTSWQPVIQECCVYVDVTKLWDEDRPDATLEQWADTYLNKVSGTINASDGCRDAVVGFCAHPCGKPFKHDDMWLVELTN